MRYLSAVIIFGTINLFAVEFRAVNAIGGVNLRKEPRKNAAVLTIVPDATIVKIMGRREDSLETIDGFKGIWLNVEVDGKNGWIFSRFLTEFQVAEDCVKFFGRVEGQPHSGQKLICGQDQERLLLNAQWLSRRMLEENIKWNPEGSKTKLRQLNKIVQINEIKGNLAIVTVPNIVDDVFTFIEPKSVWVFSENYWQPLRIGKRASEAYLVDINDDHHLDAIESSGCCGWVGVRIYFGQANGKMQSVFEKAFLGDADFKLSPKACKDFRIAGAEIVGAETNTNPRRIYSFNCSDGKFVSTPMRE